MSKAKSIDGDKNHRRTVFMTLPFIYDQVRKQTY
jgi:hypothetical protein